ncbi:hypothetical protein B296_00016016 [Ensete ventricosum]|uniref:THUMP domain-containing protein n=1 Tax=Ensete ventricosum TaxID=4639 RepID=A0A427B6E1_ENSVE|nr:hypothetical protein B296_00016016 [Ensete ventricosum]
MAGEKKPNSNSNDNNYSKGKKRKYLPHGVNVIFKPVKKGLYPLRPGVQGVFLTCDGGRERQATNEALNLLETYYEELVHGKKSDVKCSAVPSKPLNKIIKFRDSDSSSDEDEDSPHADESDASLRDHGDLQTKKVKEDASPSHEEEPEMQKPAEETEDLPSKKQRVNTCAAKVENVECTQTDDKPIDELIEDELRELGDRNKVGFHCD